MATGENILKKILTKILNKIYLKNRSKLNLKLKRRTTMEEMTVGRALKEVKMLDSRIEKEINSAIFVDAYQKKSQRLIKTPVSKVDFEKNALASYDKINDLIKRRHACKAAILKSNATATVTVKGSVYIVIDAIERKRAVELEKGLLKKMSKEYVLIQSDLDKNNADIDQKIQAMLKDTLSEDQSKTDYEKTYQLVRDSNELTLVDPLSIKRKIDELDLKIDEFLNDVDYALSESNATTKIQF